MEKFLSSEFSVAIMITLFRRPGQSAGHQVLIFRGLLIFVIFSFGTNLVSANELKPLERVAEVLQGGKNTSLNTGISKFALIVAQLGVLRCVERADQLAKFLGRGNREVIILSRPGPNPSGEMLSATLLVPTEADGSSIVEINLSPSPAGCAASYSAITQTAENCSQSESKLFSSLEFKPLAEVPYRFAMIGEAARVLSKEIIGGCLLIKHEVIR